jgi:predicted MFS family arabinose efflux permease
MDAAGRKPKAFSSYQILVIALLACTQFTVVLDFMVMSPLGDILMKKLNISPAQFGIVVSVYAIAAGCSGFLTAGFADKFDRKKLLIFFYTGFIIGTLFCALSNTYGMLVFSRIVTGIFGGVISSISLAIVADLFDLNHRGRVMGFLQMGFGMSQVLGIPISLYLANILNWQAPFYLVVALALIILLFLIFFMKPVNAHLAIHRGNALQHMWKTIQNRDYRIGFLATAFMSLGGYLMMPWGSAYAVNNIGLSQAELPVLFMAVGVVTLLVMPLTGNLSDRFDKYTVFLVASFLMVFAILIYVHLPRVSLTILILVNILMMAGIMARMVPSQALTASIPDLPDRGAFMSINSSLQQLAGGVAALLGGWIVKQQTETSPLERFDILGYVVIGIIIANVFLTFRVAKLVNSKRNESAT